MPLVWFSHWISMGESDMDKTTEWPGWTSTQVQSHEHHRRQPSFDISWLDARQEPWHRQGYLGAHILTDCLIYAHLQQGWGSLSYSGLDEGGGEGRSLSLNSPWFAMAARCIYLFMSWWMEMQLRTSRLYGLRREQNTKHWASKEIKGLPTCTQRCSRWPAFSLRSRLAWKWFVFNYACLMRVYV